MKTKIIIGIVVLIGIIGIMVSISGGPSSDVSPNNTPATSSDVFPNNPPATSFDVSRADGQCHELMYDGDINSWVEFKHDKHGYFIFS